MKKKRNHILPFQFGIALLSPMLFFIFVSVWLQKKFHLGYWIFIVGIIIGALSILYQFYRLYFKMKKKSNLINKPVNYNLHE